GGGRGGGGGGEVGGSPAVMTEFMWSYTPAMRSNIARTCGSCSVPGDGAPIVTPLLELRQEYDERVELLRRELTERRHRRRRVDQPLGDSRRVGPAAQRRHRRP